MIEFYDAAVKSIDVYYFHSGLISGTAFSFLCRESYFY